MSGAMLARVKSFARGFTPHGRLSRRLAPFLPQVLCVDVGASYYPHVKWYLFLESPGTRWVAVEPNSANLAYLNSWGWPSQAVSFTTGLSRDGGTQTLFVTNVDSGSSLLEPVIPPGMKRRVRNLDYFFPVKRRDIETSTLRAVIAQQPGVAPVFVKLDTQGTELSILLGAEDLLRQRRIIGIELEATLLAQPIMKGAARFREAAHYLEDLGLELLLIHPIYGPSRFGAAKPRGLTYINECDAVFAVRQDVAAELSVEQRTALFAFYLCNRLYEEGRAFLSEDPSVAEHLRSRGCDVAALVSAIEAMP
jgi:FkbM family methyltransferase